MKALKKIGKVILVIIGCILMPVLIWVALAAAIYHRIRVFRTHKVPAWEQVLAGYKR
ncbi:MAG: hypothetical protein Q8O16_03060 [Dehalococcoidia bacterium]|nr:hypothetical protein [Dehalococcoidia bacterium]